MSEVSKVEGQEGQVEEKPFPRAIPGESVLYCTGPGSHVAAIITAVDDLSNPDIVSLALIKQVSPSEPSQFRAGKTIDSVFRVPHSSVPRMGCWTRIREARAALS